MDLTLNSTVGPSGQNHPEDVKLVRALLNVHRRKVRDPALAIAGNTDPELFAAIARFQVAHGVSVASGTIKPRSSSWQWLLDGLAASRTVEAIVPPTTGRLTWDAEGQEGGRFHSRILHVYSANSGLTLGRGYDMRDRGRVDAQRHLSSAGLAAADACAIAGGARLRGRSAEHFIIASDRLDFEISPKCQLKLFNIVYGEVESDVKRLCAKQDVVAAYGAVNWNQLDRRIRDVLVDLHYRGDYTAQTCRLLQASVAANDRAAFTAVMADRAHWAGVPQDRFQRRNLSLA